MAHWEQNDALQIALDLLGSHYDLELPYKIIRTLLSHILSQSLKGKLTHLHRPKQLKTPTPNLVLLLHFIDVC